MLDIFFSISFFIFGIFCLFLSKSKKNYQKLVEGNGEKFASRVNKGIKLGAYLLLIASISLVLLNYL